MEILNQPGKHLIQRDAHQATDFNQLKVQLYFNA